jgi:hypothetical protein
MKKVYLIFLLFITLVSCSISDSQPKPSSPWTFHSKEISLKEKRIYHITEEGYAVYLTGDGEGYGKMITLSPNGKKVWAKELGTSFTIRVNNPPALYLTEEGKISKYNLNTGEKMRTIKIPVKGNATELYGISPNNTLFVFDWDTMKILEMSEKGKKIATVPFSQDTVQKLELQKPNMENLFRQPPDNISHLLNTKTIPAFIKNRKNFEAKYGKEAKYYPYLKAKEHGDKLYILAYYQINSTKANQETFSHSVLFIFSKSGNFLSETDLGDYNGTDIDVSSSGHVYVSLNNINSLEPYTFIKILDHNLVNLKEIKLSNEYIMDGKLHKDNLYVVTNKNFYFYPNKDLP